MERMTMSNLQTPFRYDFVGSFLRPEKLKKARRQFNEGKIDAAALKKVEDEAITELVSKIKELGYHVITDGEFRRATWHLDFMWESSAETTTSSFLSRIVRQASFSSPFAKGRRRIVAVTLNTL